jgi:uncharacterized protein YecE (DUF72 family)
MMTNGNADPKAVPSAVRHLLPARSATAGSNSVQLRHTSSEFQAALWSIQNRLLRTVHENGRLGLVVFQFPLSFTPTDANRAHVRWCRQHLAAECVMAVEFRCRLWFKDEAEIDRTVRFVRELDSVLVAEDDLEHEVTGRFIPLPPGQAPRRLPIHLHLAAPHALYVRMHRRQGNQRVLADAEFEEWPRRFDEARREGDSGSSDVKPLAGPIYYLIGSDHEDQPIINSLKMQAALAAYDDRRTEEWRLATASNGNHASSAAAAASSSDSVVPAMPPPEPLLFDYRRFFKTHLARLPAGVASDRQTSLGAFFAAHAQPSAAAAAFSTDAHHPVTAAAVSSPPASSAADTRASTSVAAAAASSASAPSASSVASFFASHPQPPGGDEVVELHERTRIVASPSTPQRHADAKRKANESGASGSSSKKSKRNTSASSASVAAAAAATPSVASFFQRKA